ncbi:hypothetical protein DPEC_G00029760 [Dallia pectoralis]|uniref:Uncharacterized protein n=1 Tax=Dallia pectoralis TaxID=75939 RepID=A0ACC2HJ86_DALPE|nr:hypothetical protein DPEC_G00029760 [Dallia pectoralis]
MASSNDSCGSVEDLRKYQHHVYTVFYSVILAPGLLGNVLALWIFQVYVRETKRGVVFMMNLAVADLMQVLSLPLRIYYYLNNTWPFGQSLCILCFYLKYVNMYASIYFLVCVSVRRCQLIMHPLRNRTNRRRGDVCVCAIGWLLVCVCCLPFPLLRITDPPSTSQTGSYNYSLDLYLSTSYAPTQKPSVTSVCFAELPMQELSPGAGWALMITAELFGFILPLALVLTCSCLTAGNLRRHGKFEVGAGLGVQDPGDKRRALRMVLSCAGVFLVCFVPYHVTMPLDYLAKAGALGDWCQVKEMVLTWHPVTLCLASLNSGLDPVMYYFTTDEFRRRFSRPELPESFSLAPRLSYTSGKLKLASGKPLSRELYHLNPQISLN